MVDDCGVSEQARGTRGTQDSLACSPFPFWSFRYVNQAVGHYLAVKVARSVKQSKLWPSKTLKDSSETGENVRYVTDKSGQESFEGSKESVHPPDPSPLRCGGVTTYSTCPMWWWLPQYACFWRDDLSIAEFDTVNDDGPPCLAVHLIRILPLCPCVIHVAFSLLVFLRASPPPEGVDRSPLSCLPSHRVCQSIGKVACCTS